MNKVNRTLSLIFLTLLAGCGLEKEIDYETFYRGDQIVVHGFISRDNGVHAIVKKTLPPDKFEESDKIVNPSVWLYENNEPLIQLIEKYPSFYISPDGLQLNSSKSYRIQISCEGFETVKSAPQQLVNKMFIDTVYVSRSVKEELKYFLAVVFNDIEDEKNYFTYKTHKFYKGIDDYHSSEFIYPLGVKKDDDYNSDQIVWEVEISNWISSEDDFQGFDSIQFELVTVSKDYYTYGRSADYYDATKASEFGEYVFPIFSNIENGVGFFASYETSTYTFYPPSNITY
jgi:hypothetical protein